MNCGRKAWFAAPVLLLAIISHAQVPPTKSGPDQQTHPSVPLFNVMRDEEDWTTLRDPAARKDLLDNAKFIPLRSSDPESFVSLGGEIREWYEHFDNEDWGVIPGSNSYLLQRYMVHADFHFSEHARFFFQLKAGLEDYRRTGPRPVDEDRFDINQGYLDLNFRVRARDPHAPPAYGTPSGDDLHSLVIVRVGRQELNFGSGRLISAREGVNVRAGFDGGRVILEPANWRIDAFYVKPVNTNPGVLDDNADASQSVSGMYATEPLLSLPKGTTLDLYYLGKNDADTFAELLTEDFIYTSPMCEVVERQVYLDNLRAKTVVMKYTHVADLQVRQRNISSTVL